MNDINLKKCTKEELKETITYNLKNLDGIYYVTLEDIFTEEPTIKFLEYNNRVLDFIAIFEYDVIINNFSNDYSFYDDPTNFIDSLYNFICEYYR